MTWREGSLETEPQSVAQAVQEFTKQSSLALNLQLQNAGDNWHALLHVFALHIGFLKVQSSIY